MSYQFYFLQLPKEQLWNENAWDYIVDQKKDRIPHGDQQTYYLQVLIKTYMYPRHLNIENTWMRNHLEKYKLTYIKSEASKTLEGLLDHNQ